MTRPTLILVIFLVLGVCLEWASSLAMAQPAADTSGFDDLVEAALAFKANQPAVTCHDGDVSRAGLRINEGIVVASDLLGDINGYAAVAGTTGGLGGRLLLVTDPRDYNTSKGERRIVGTLRDRLETASASREPAWIMFGSLFSEETKIDLKQTLVVPGNVTIDGSCANVTLEAPSEKYISFFHISDVQNVIVTRIAMRKVGYVPELHPSSGSSIFINGSFDRIAIIHNDLSECGHSCIDITTSPGRPVPTAARATISRNYFHHHDKVLLFGTFTCPQVRGLNHCNERYFAESRHLPAGLYLTLEGNLFLMTGQRHPHVFGRAMAHVSSNFVAFRARRRADGKFGSTFAVSVTNAARAFIEGNVFLPMEGKRSPPLAAWTVTSPGALLMPTDTEGFIRLGRNTLVNQAIAAENSPSEVSTPPYSTGTPSLADLSLEAALACLSRSAGRKASAQWDRTTCWP